MPTATKEKAARPAVAPDAGAITLGRDALVEAMERALIGTTRKGGKEARQLLPLYGAAHLAFGEGNKVVITATNTEIAVRTSVPFDGEWEGGDLCINAAVFASWVEKVEKGARIKLSRVRNTLHMSSGRAKGQVQSSMDVDDYPPLDFEPSPNELARVVAAPDLKAGIAQGSVAATVKSALSASSYAYGGVLYWRYVASDGLLSLRSFGASCAAHRVLTAAEGEDFEAMIPASLAALLAKLLPADGSVSLWFNRRNQMLLQIGPSLVTLSQVKTDAKPEIATLVERIVEPTVARVERAPLMNALGRACVFGVEFDKDSDDVLFHLAIDPATACVRLSGSKRHTHGSAVDEVEAEIEGEAVGNALSYAMFNAGLGSFSGDIELRVCGGVIPLALVDRNDERQIFLMAPIQMGEDA